MASLRAHERTAPRIRISSAGDWPAPADAAAGERLADRFAAIGEAEAGLAADPAGSALLRCLGGNSPYLADLALRESAALLPACARRARPVAVRQAMAAIAALPAARRRARRSPRRCARPSGVSPWPPPSPTSAASGTSTASPRALSDLAEAALRARSPICCAPAHDSGELRLPASRRARARQRLHRARHGQARRARTELLQRCRPRAAVRPGRRASITGERACGALLLPAGARSSGLDGSARRRRLRVPHRPAAAPRPVGHAALHRPAGGHRLLRKHGPELGTRRHAQGAPGGRRPRARRRVSRRHPPLRLAPPPGFRRAGRHPRHEAAHRRAQGHRRLAPQATRWRASPGTTSSSARAASAKSSSWRRRCNWSGAAATRRCACPRTLEALALLAGAGHLPRRTAVANCRRLPLPAPCRAPAANGGRPADPRAAGATPAQPGARSPTFMGYADAAALRRGAAAPSDARAARATPELFEARARPARGRRRRRRWISAAPATRRRHRRRRCRHGLRRHRARHRGGARLAGRPRARAALGARPRPDARSAARPAGRARPARPQPDAGVRPVRRLPRHACPPACSCCRCSSATRRCSTASPRCSAPRRRSPTIWPACRRRWRGCWRRTERSQPRARRCARGWPMRAALEDALAIIRPTVRAEDFAISVATMEGRIDADAAGERAHRAGRCGAGGAVAARAGRFRRAFRPRAGRRHGGGGAGQGRLAAK